MFSYIYYFYLILNIKSGLIENIAQNKLQYVEIWFENSQSFSEKWMHLTKFYDLAWDFYIMDLWYKNMTTKLLQFFLYLFSFFQNRKLFIFLYYYIHYCLHYIFIFSKIIILFYFFMEAKLAVKRNTLIQIIDLEMLSKY